MDISNNLDAPNLFEETKVKKKDSESLTWENRRELMQNLVKQSLIN